ncbi:hypothetical protein GIX45_23125 [Erwinia sp. CPCC 100877]|nr:hypothetical protein [Erwinia sp. CPCC 100877]
MKNKKRNPLFKYLYVILLMLFFTACKKTMEPEVEKVDDKLNTALIEKLAGTWQAQNYDYGTYKIEVFETHLQLNEERLLFHYTKDALVCTKTHEADEFYYDFKLIDDALTIYRWFPDKPGSTGGGGIQPIELTRVL